LVDSATKCRATASGARSAASSQALAELALARVPGVVKVFEATMNSVVSGSRLASSVPADVRGIDVGDEVHPHAFHRVGSSAWHTIAGPRSEPPMPMFTTSRIGLPVWPLPGAAAHRVGEGLRIVVEHGVRRRA
jgi:hypothetical protein